VINRIAFFDFDGTITTRDSLLEFIKFSKGRPHFYLGFLLNSPWLLAYKVGLISNQAAKERIMRFFFGGMSMPAFQSLCDRFSAEVLPGLVRPKARMEIERLRALDTRIVIVSASPENWLSDFSKQSGADLIATRLATKGERITGRIEGLNCHGEEKVIRIKKAYRLSDYDERYAYGDSRGDRPMLALATISFFRPFR
jgi:phosphatidylglycerophosphatase C